MNTKEGVIRILSRRDGAATVLVVDDVDTNRRLLEILLQSEGYQVYSAQTGADALRQIALRVPDLLLLDLALPDMHGSQVLARIRHEGFRFPVLVITGDSSPAGRATTLHATEFLTKPYDVEALVAAVARLVDSGSE